MVLRFVCFSITSKTPFHVLFQAIRTCQLDIDGLPALCQELIDNWSKVTSYLSKYAPNPGMQVVRKEVLMPLLV